MKMNQEYKIARFQIDLQEQDRSLFLPAGAQILELYYEALTPDLATVYPIGGIDRVILFKALKDKLEHGLNENVDQFVNMIQTHSLGFPGPRKFTEIRMVIKALVPASKPKGKYA